MDMNILIVDDKSSVRSALEQHLGKLGFDQISQARDGARGWEMLNTTTPAFDLVISDLEMPGMNGLELLRSVRCSPTLGSLSFIIATTVQDRDVILEILALGIDAYITKPFNHKDLALKLKQAGIL